MKPRFPALERLLLAIAALIFGPATLLPLILAQPMSEGTSTALVVDSSKSAANFADQLKAEGKHIFNVLPDGERVILTTVDAAVPAQRPPSL